MKSESIEKVLKMQEVIRVAMRVNGGDMSDATAWLLRDVDRMRAQDPPNERGAAFLEDTLQWWGRHTTWDLELWHHLVEPDKTRVPRLPKAKKW